MEKFWLKGEVRTVRAEDIKQAYVFETEGYPEDEGASYETLVYRQEVAPDLFLGYYEDDKLIGYVCGTRHSGPRLLAEAMETHQPLGACVCVHSVCIDVHRRREGIGTRLMKAYTQHIRNTQDSATKLLLVCKAAKIPFYTRVGYTYVDRSTLQHGKDKWHEMELRL